ncbi:CU044_5270 family protein [Actinomadura rifamycini]|uniref:CU044_5270 family protein n=1 Tax=Actinomadura rifamycini TaxID=31962 RepID=UPI00041F2E9C|nr:CU044_5270 family protein [Actinomadura rifamycini]
MDEMKLLHDRYTALPGPGPRAGAEARARLEDHMRSDRTHRTRRPRARRVRPVWGLSLAAGAAAAIGVATVALPADGGPAPAVRAPSAQTIMLAAAEKAEGAPASGKYWKVATVGLANGTHVEASWTTADGRRWVAFRTDRPTDGSPATGLSRAKGPRPSGPTVLGPDPSPAELRNLPSDPGKLKALAERNVPRIAPDAESGSAPITREGYLLEAFVGLLTRQPVEPGVRAAAFRVLADLPGVASAGKATDGLGRKGVAVRFTQTTPQSGGTRIRLIIDPETSRVLAEQVTADAKRKNGAKSTVHYLDAVWTNEPPAVPALP